eukprot:CAMPEP_0117669910 /NCGR_PEP_ID=MMETSP0804-20121206/12419_1 /TAXON_ID=1074897 /ORGANISM="Tetraselmis astigmatica, Strain CCMP880" /LENGTH=377 /DNA_ID=CAMNT_0005478069 /DNA_START=119 /DNA_END=1252 /DNA_ORIENTATION=+
MPSIVSPSAQESAGASNPELPQQRAKIEPLQPIQDRSAWYAADYTGKDSYTYYLTPQDVAELDQAVYLVETRGLDIQAVKREDFPLPELGSKLTAFKQEVEWGRGFQLISGFPVDKYTRKQTMIAYWGVGTYWGNARPNNKKGHLIGHIKDIGADPNLPDTRLYATHDAQPWHNDNADMVSLLCLHPAADGGESGWASSITVYNEILRQRPDLAELFCGEWYYDRKGEIPAGKDPFFLIPVFNFFQGHLSVNYSDNYFRLSQRHASVPRFTPAHHEAMELFNELARSEEIHLKYYLQPGDIQLLNNHTCLHYRGAFTDGPDEKHQRHLLRLLLSPEDARPLPPVYEEIMAGIQPGSRGGINVSGMEGVTPHVSLEAE